MCVLQTTGRVSEFAGESSVDGRPWAFVSRSGSWGTWLCVGKWWWSGRGAFAGSWRGGGWSFIARATWLASSMMKKCRLDGKGSAIVNEGTPHSNTSEKKITKTTHRWIKTRKFLKWNNFLKWNGNLEWDTKFNCSFNACFLFWGRGGSVSPHGGWHVRHNDWPILYRDSKEDRFEIDLSPRVHRWAWQCSEPWSTLVDPV